MGHFAFVPGSIRKYGVIQLCVHMGKISMKPSDARTAELRYSNTAVRLHCLRRGKQCGNPFKMGAFPRVYVSGLRAPPHAYQRVRLTAHCLDILNSPKWPQKLPYNGVTSIRVILITYVNFPRPTGLILILTCRCK